MDVNVASWGTTGGWKENAIVIKNHNACDTARTLLGQAWFTAIKLFGCTNNKCPMPAVTCILLKIRIIY